jgi:hypothetical protein
MPTLDRNEHRVTNFGLFSKRNMDRVAALLDSSGVRYYFDEETGDKENLRDWDAWQQQLFTMSESKCLPEKGQMQ